MLDRTCGDLIRAGVTIIVNCIVGQININAGCGAVKVKQVESHSAVVEVIAGASIRRRASAGRRVRHDRVVAGATVDYVITGVTDQSVVLIVASDFVVAGTAKHGLDIFNVTHNRVAVTLDQIAVKVNHKIVGICLLIDCVGVILNGRCVGIV